MIIKIITTLLTTIISIKAIDAISNIKHGIKNICFVVDQYGKTTNGCISFTKEWTKELIKRGYNISIICGNGISEYGEKVFEMGSKKRGIINREAKKQGMAFAEINKSKVKEALENIDVVHFITQFDLSKYVKDYCDKNSITTTVTFPTLPHNVAYARKVPCKSIITSITNRIWKKFYDKFKHCNSTSKLVDKYLKEKQYKSTLHMFYNGISYDFQKKNIVKPNEYAGKFVIITVGRLSNEKKQDLIIKAVNNSKYKNKIKLIIAGNGPNEKTLRKLAKKYKIDCEFNFYNREELINVLNICDVYIHAADIEAMGMSCIEAICCGVTPIINNSELSGATEFALSDKNLFKYNDYKDLTKKIDYFIENKDELESYSKEYISISSEYRIDKTVDNLLEMMNTAYKEDHNK